MPIAYAIYTTLFAILAATVEKKKTKQYKEIISKSLTTFAKVHNLYESLLYNTDVMNL